MPEITEIITILNDDTKLRELGASITEKAMAATIEEKLGLVPSYAPTMREIQPGDPVPPDLVTKVPIGADGLASADWSDSGWTDIGIWERATWDKTTGDAQIGISDINTLPPLDMEQLLSKLTAGEIDVLRGMNYIP